MKRTMTGGTHRGPLGLRRQRRTIRFVQVLLVITAAALLLFAGYAWGRSAGYDAGARAGDIDAPRPPSGAQTVVLAVLGLVALGGALALQGDGTVRIPTPSRLDELAGRAERQAIERAEKVAGEGRAEGPPPPPPASAPAPSAPPPPAAS
ncbi:MAG TPA: hypothetical protein VHN37_07830 [Actinomycetota bacterium]|nr:hypothetical protein [Actinomycetota bacterium]